MCKCIYIQKTSLIYNKTLIISFQRQFFSMISGSINLFYDDPCSNDIIFKIYRFERSIGLGSSQIVLDTHTWKSRPSHFPVLIQKNVKRAGARCSGGTGTSTNSAPVPVGVEPVSLARSQSLQVQCSRNGADAWTRKVPPAGKHRTCRLNFHISIGAADRRLR